MDFTKHRKRADVRISPGKSTNIASVNLSEIERIRETYSLPRYAIYPPPAPSHQPRPASCDDLAYHPVQIQICTQEHSHSATTVNSNDHCDASAKVTFMENTNRSHDLSTALDVYAPSSATSTPRMPETPVPQSSKKPVPQLPVVGASTKDFLDSLRSFRAMLEARPDSTNVPGGSSPPAASFPSLRRLLAATAATSVDPHPPSSVSTGSADAHVPIDTDADSFPPLSASPALTPRLTPSPSPTTPGSPPSPSSLDAHTPVYRPRSHSRGHSWGHQCSGDDPCPCPCPRCPCPCVCRCHAAPNPGRAYSAGGHGGEAEDEAGAEADASVRADMADETDNCISSTDAGAEVPVPLASSLLDDVDDGPPPAAPHEGTPLAQSPTPPPAHPAPASRPRLRLPRQPSPPQLPNTRPQVDWSQQSQSQMTMLPPPTSLPREWLELRSLSQTRDGLTYRTPSLLPLHQLESLARLPPSQSTTVARLQRDSEISEEEEDELDVEAARVMRAIQKILNSGISSLRKSTNG
jgi:hypothetical protein